ncbi:MAG: TrmH family RNA methyltransferase [Bacteroidales bacterium]|jgi:TrmH family RNA methyltransferase|nr:TrmH family RNA methyltransferase [Bacteroidales bacterium]
MITIKKLNSLPEDTKIRKVIRLLESFTHDKNIDRTYLIDVCNIIVSSNEKRVSDETKDKAHTLMFMMQEKDVDTWLLSDLLFLLMSDMKMSVGDWDFVDDDNQLDADKRTHFPISVVLDRIRSPFNVGSMFRSADSFATSHIYLTTPCAEVSHPRTLRSAAGCTHCVPYTTGTPSQIIELIQDKPVFALEVGGNELETFSFPPHGVMIVGSEELGVSPELLEIAKSSLGVVSIPLFGTKGSLNVSTAFSIAMYSWVMAIKEHY